MNIAIQRGLSLDSLKSTLQGLGHNVFYIGENQAADAVLYNEPDTHPYYDVNNIPSATASVAGENAAYGALLVNVSNKTEDEIVRILTSRVYSPLF
ncbi:MAG: hypothetical protein K0Q65_255 [Clostridia bacterium]|nr:hypothetical protein [Clostridia bacterium]